MFSNSARRKLVMVFGILALLACALYWGVSYLVMNRVTLVDAKCERRDGEYAYTPADFSRQDFDTTPYLMESYETVSIPSRTEGITVSGWFIPNQADPELSETYPTVILVHGFSDCRNRPFSLTPAGMLTHNGFNALAIDLRDHGDSTVEDGRMAAGAEEYLDVLGAWDWLIAEKGLSPEQIGLFGYSMGGASVLIAAGEEPQVAAVWEDSSFSTFEDEIYFQMSENGIPSFVVDGILMTHDTLTDDDFSTLTPLNAVGKIAPRPLYILHGAEDTTVPVEDASVLADAYRAAGGTVEPWIVPDTDHIEAMFNEPDEYESRLLGFFGEHLGAGE
jgi:uncharacterized protein